MPDSLDVPGAHLQLGRHHPPASRGVEAVPDHGPHLAQDHEQMQERPEGLFGTLCRDSAWCKMLSQT